MFTVKGNIVEVLGDQKISNSVMRSFVITTGGDKPKTMKFDLWNEKASLVENSAIGSVAEVGFDVESKPYNGKYFTNLRAYAVTVEESAKTSKTSKSAKATKAPVIEPDENFDDLPF